MLKLESMADLDQLIKNEIPESLTLEYKASDSLGRSNDQRKELVKDVSAFANSAGFKSSMELWRQSASSLALTGPIRPSPRMD